MEFCLACFLQTGMMVGTTSPRRDSSNEQLCQLPASYQFPWPAKDILCKSSSVMRSKIPEMYALTCHLVLGVAPKCASGHGPVHFGSKRKPPRHDFRASHASCRAFFFGQPPSAHFCPDSLPQNPGLAIPAVSPQGYGQWCPALQHGTAQETKSARCAKGTARSQDDVLAPWPPRCAPLGPRQLQLEGAQRAEHLAEGPASRSLRQKSLQTATNGRERTKPLKDQKATSMHSQKLESCTGLFCLHFECRWLRLITHTHTPEAERNSRPNQHCFRKASNLPEKFWLPCCFLRAGAKPICAAARLGGPPC